MRDADGLAAPATDAATADGIDARGDRHAAVAGIEMTPALRLALASLLALASSAAFSAPHLPDTPMDAHVAGGGCPSGLCLAVTVTTDPPPACGSATTLAVASGTRVNFCYTVTNGTGSTLGYHSLVDDVDGELFWLAPQTLAPGASYQYHRSATIFETTTVDSTWTAQDIAPDYTPTVNPVGSFVDITGIGTPLGISNEHMQGVTLPFAFDFYGRESDHVCVSSDGFVLFDLWPCPPYAYYAARPIPTPVMPAPVFMPLWEELTDASGEIYVATLGTAPNRQFVVEWHDRPPYGHVDPFTIELILDEADGRISFQYADVDTDGPFGSHGMLGTVGLQANAALAYQFSNFTPSLTSGMGIDWAPNAPSVVSDSASATVTASGATVTLDPVVLTASGMGGTVTTAHVSVGNSGSAPLTWSFAEATRAPTSPPVTGDVPSFAMNLTDGSFVRFDASAPDSLNPVASTDYRLTAGDFVDNNPLQVFGIDGISAAHRNALVTVSIVDGSVQEIGTANALGTADWAALKWDPVDRTLYGVTSDCGLTNSTLYRISRSTGFATRIGPIAASGHNCVVDIAINSSGRMYGVESGFENALIAIDKTDGSATAIGLLGVDASGDQGLDFDDMSGFLWWARYDAMAPGGPVSEMRTINPNNALSTVIGPIGDGATEIDAFAIGSVGNCSSPEDIPWLAMSPPSGTVDGGDSTDVAIALDATGLDPGVYQAMICVNTNDQTTPLEQLPVEFTVYSADDVIFRDGFDNP